MSNKRIERTKASEQRTAARIVLRRRRGVRRGDAQRRRAHGGAGPRAAHARRVAVKVVQRTELVLADAADGGDEVERGDVVELRRLLEDAVEVLARHRGGDALRRLAHRDVQGEHFALLTRRGLWSDGVQAQLAVGEGVKPRELSSKMLGGASQTVSKIRVKCNGT